MRRKQFELYKYILRAHLLVYGVLKLNKWISSVVEYSGKDSFKVVRHQVMEMCAHVVVGVYICSWFKRNIKTSCI